MKEPVTGIVICASEGENGPFHSAVFNLDEIDIGEARKLVNGGELNMPDFVERAMSVDAVMVGKNGRCETVRIR